MAGDWTIDVLTHDGASTLHTAAPYHSATVTWSIDGPGSIEVSLTRDQLDTGPWRAGRRRLLVKRLTVPQWQGFHLNLARGAPPRDGSRGQRYNASGLGLAHALDRRLIHGRRLVFYNTTAHIAWSLIHNAMVQPDGDEGFSNGTHTGTPLTRRRKYCVGDNIADKINELAEFKTGGFDWEIDVNGNFNTWTPRRGDNLTSTFTLTEADTTEWNVEEEAADIITYVLVASHSLNTHRVRKSTLRTEEGRREELLELTHPRSTKQMDQRGDAELHTRGEAQIELKARWLDGRGPWDWGDVWLGDRVNVELESAFGGEQHMRVQDISVSLEGNNLNFVEYTLIGHDDALTESPDYESGESSNDQSFEESFGETS